MTKVPSLTRTIHKRDTIGLLLYSSQRNGVEGWGNSISLPCYFVLAQNKTKKNKKTKNKNKKSFRIAELTFTLNIVMIFKRREKNRLTLQLTSEHKRLICEFNTEHPLFAMHEH